MTRRVDPALDDERRIYYRITALGRRALTAEVERYRRAVTVAQARNIVPNTLAYEA